jgi:hypothetical protein
MPQYMLLIYGPTEGGPSPEEMQAEMPKWYEYTQALQDAGVMVAGDALQPTETATTVRVRNDETLVADGPFAETKEALGGFYLLECASKEEALEWAKKVPIGENGFVDVRPIWQM